MPVITPLNGSNYIKIVTQFDDQQLEISLLEKLLELFTTNLGRLCAGQ